MKCRLHFQKLVHENPPDVGSQAAFVAWVIRLHNLVNVHLGKPTWAWSPFIPHGCPFNFFVSITTGISFSSVFWLTIMATEGSHATWLPVPSLSAAAVVYL